MKVSVVICTLNRERILPEVIPSINKSPLVDELIIIEGTYRPIGYARNFGWKES